MTEEEIEIMAAKVADIIIARLYSGLQPSYPAIPFYPNIAPVQQPMPTPWYVGDYPVGGCGFGALTGDITATSGQQFQNDIKQQGGISTAGHVSWSTPDNEG